ncbi:MAG: primosomal protein N' [Bacteroidota bacterium]|nr:primosomal protein N' [Bacteroidota bacterium]
MSHFSKPHFADLILPLALSRLYTYRVPDVMAADIRPGQRVIVQFGKSKMYTAVVYTLHNEVPEHYEAKEIIEVIDTEPVITEKQFRLWEWMSEYYLCTLGEIMIAALPSIMKLQSETVVSISPSFVLGIAVLTAEEQLLIDHLNEFGSMSVSDASKLTGLKNGLRLVRNMMDNNILAPHEEMQHAFRPRQVTYVRLSVAARDEKFMQEIFARIEKKAPKQLHVLMSFMQMMQEKGRDFFSRTQFLKQSGAGSSALQQLVSKGVMELFEDEESLSVAPAISTGLQVELSEVQQGAYEKIEDAFHRNKVTLLHGVTSSGKTEVYVRLINDTIGSGKQVLYLLPEIALTTQIISRLKRHFGDQLLVFHSRFSNRERADVYMKLLNDGENGIFRYPIIVGARSSIFLPLKNPGLILVDEEHDSSYKQQDPAPRYNARDTAIVCAQIHGSHVLLGSATPGMESFQNAESGKFELVVMNERYGGMKLPVIKIVDLKEAYRKQQMKSYFSQELLDGIKLALDAKEQVILFQNRRGFAPVLECKKCGWIPQCVNCDVSLTYHKKSNHLRCHYCGYTTYLPAKCLACGDPDVRMKGMGTERIEDEISIFFPDHNVQRLDLDTTSSKFAFQRIINGFENGEIDILVGTQMVTKGLDFDRVSLVGVLNADGLIKFPDFRAAERSYQLLAQVAGRSGRKFKQGQVLIQTYEVKHPILQFLQQNDYAGFYNYELAERNKYNYPPFFRLIELRLKLKDEKLLELLAKDFARELRLVFGKRVLGPVVPPVARVRNYYLQNVLIKVEKSLSNQKVKQMLSRVTDRFLSHPENRSLFIQVDVDPQ